MTIDKSAAIIPLEEYERLKFFEKAVNERLTVRWDYGYKTYFIDTDYQVINNLSKEINLVKDQMDHDNNQYRTRMRQLDYEIETLKKEAVSKLPKKRFKWL